MFFRDGFKIKISKLNISKVNNIEYINKISSNTVDKSVQTDSLSLFKQENEEKNNEKDRKQRKNDTDLIRNKLFIYINNMLYNWIKISKKEDDEIEIVQYHFNNINKNSIAALINKYLKDLFLTDSNLADKINNELLKEKLESKYETIYNYFISGKNDTDKIKKNVDFWKNFYFLEDYLKELKEKENYFYINRMKTISLEYKKWLNNKVHLFKNNESS